MLPSAGIVIPIFVLWARYKILNTIFGLSLAHLVTAIPMAVWLMKGFFDQVPFEVEESAFVDGASRLTTLFRITLPMALPGVAVTALMVFFGSYIELFFAVILMGINKPLPAYIASFVTEHRMFWQEMMASSILSMIPMLVYFSLLQKYMLRGIYLVGTGGR